jgi:NitT/TauT family transport system substrate-binding protein
MKGKISHWFRSGGAFNTLFKVMALAVPVLLYANCGGKTGAGNKTERGQETDTIRLGVMTNGITDYAAAIGLSEGIFKKYGLDVEVTSFSWGINTIDAVTLGQIDIGGGADFAVLNRLGGSRTTPLRIFAGLGGVLNNSLFYTRDPLVQSLADLRGKSVLVSLGTVDEYYHAKAFGAAGVPLSSIKFLPVDAAMEAVTLIQNGSAQGTWANGQKAAALDKLDGIHTVARLSDYVESTVHVGIATTQFLSERQRAVEQYLLATGEIYDFIEKDPQKAAEIINKTNGTPIDQCLIVFKTWVNYIEFDQKFFDTMNSLKAWADDAGVIKNPYDLRDYVQLDALRAAFPGRGEFK